MKKMICEICESQKIKKENGVFVCQNCGAEYSLEDAKKLLKDIEETSVIENIKDVELTPVKNDEAKETLLEHLFSWLKVLSVFENRNFWLDRWDCNIKTDFLLTDESVYNAFKCDIKNLNPRKFYELTHEDLMAILDYKFFTDSKDKAYFLNDIYGAFNVNNIFENFKSLTDDSLFKYDGKYGEEVYIDYELKPLYYFHDMKKNEDFALKKLYLNYSNILNMSCDMNNYIFYQNNIIKLSLFKSMMTNKTHDFVSQQILIPSELKNIFDNYRKLEEQLITRHNNLKKFYNDNFEYIRKLYIDAIETISILETKFNLPFKYRKVNYIIELIDIIMEGRADNWKEAANIFSFDQFAQNVVLGFKDLSNRLDTISSKLTDITSKLNSIDYGLRSLNNTTSKLCSAIMDCREALINIMFDTRLDLIWK